MAGYFTKAVVHLCTFESGGAGIAARRLDHGLRAIGVESKFLVASKSSQNPDVLALPRDPGSPRVEGERGNPLLWDSLCAQWNRALDDYPLRPSGLEIFTDTSCAYRLDRIDEIRNADIINLHWVAGLLDYAKMPELFSDKKIIWTLHDMNPFTGGCHYAGTCVRYKKSCGSCPQLGSEDEGDLSRRIWDKKRRAFESLDISVVTPSRWLAGCAQESSLLSRFPVKIIPNSVPTETFRPYPKSDVRRQLNLPEDAAIILFGSDNIHTRRKGFRYLLEAMERFRPAGPKKRVVLAVFGSAGNCAELASQYPIMELGHLASEEEVALAYNISDVFVLPSLEDNLPNTIVEALSCGVPVVGFNVGGIPDLIEHKHTGYLAESGSIEGLVDGINWCISNREYQQISSRCRTACLERYETSIQANAYLDLYADTEAGKQESIAKPAPSKDRGLESTIRKAARYARSNPYEANAYIDLAKLLHEAGDTEKALNILNQVEHLFPAEDSIPTMVSKLRAGTDRSAQEPTGSNTANSAHLPECERTNAFWIATSLAPGNIERQQRAVRSWQGLGFFVASLNSPDEIRTLRPHFPGVTFRAALRDARAAAGRPLVFFDDIMEMLGTLPGRRYGIVNSDIELRGTADTLEEIAALTADALVFGHRINIENPDDAEGSREVNGHDFFFFPRRVLTVFPKTPLCIGGPWWDYWVIMMPMLRGIELVRWEGPLGFHLKHPERWSMDLHRKFGAWTRFHYVGTLGQGVLNDPNVPLAHADNMLFALDVFSTIARRARSHFPKPAAASSSASSSTEPLWWTADKDVSSEDDLLLELPRRRPELVKQVRTLYVVGAHLFQEEQLFRKMFPNLKHIVLFEPIPSIVAHLSARIDGKPDVTLVPCAVGGRDDKAIFHVTDNFASSSLLPLKKHREIFPWVHDKEEIEVDVRRLETVMKELALPAPDLLFLDVQGAEYLVLSSLSQELLSGLLGIYTETSTDELYEGAKNLTDLQELLGELFEFRGFAPLNNQVRNHGNSIFLRRHAAPDSSAAPSAPPPGERIETRPTIFDSVHKNSPFTIATSLAPRELEKQKRAVSSWLAHGFQVVSFNEEAEVGELRSQFPEIEFVPVTRTGRERAGKPLVFLDDILAWFRKRPGLGGFVNSDIILRPPSEDWMEQLRGLCRGSLVFCRRIEIPNPDETEGRFYRTGFDSFFFDPAILTCYPTPTEYMIGFPHWDYFMILMPILGGIPVRQLIFPYAYHVSHKQYYNVVRDGIPFGLKTFHYIASSLDRIPDKDHLLMPQLEWFLKHQPSKAETPEELEFYYTFLHVLDKFFLETIDRVSIKHGPLGEVMAQTPHHFHQVPESASSPLTASQDQTAFAPPNTVTDISAKGPYTAPAGSKPSYRLSVVIPTFNRKDILLRCLDHLALQDMPKSEFEVIIIDDGSSDGTFDLRHTVHQPYSLRWLAQANQGPALARNAGIAAAGGEYILFLNDDALLEPHVLRGHIEAHRRIGDPAAAVLGRFSVHPDFVPHDTPIGYCLEHSDLSFDYYRMQDRSTYDYLYFYTCNISLRRDFILADAPFDPEFLRVGAEDIEYGYRLQQRGCKIHYEAGLLAWHAHRLDPQGLGRMFVFRGKGGVVLFIKQNHLPHHTGGMTPPEAERFRRNRERLTPVIDRLLSSLSRLGTLECRAMEAKPRTFEAEGALGSYMHLWCAPDDQLQSVAESYARSYEELEQKLAGATIIPLEDVAAALYPGLHFVKWWFDTCGVVDSPRLPDLMRLDSLKFHPGSAAEAAHHPPVDRPATEKPSETVVQPASTSPSPHAGPAPSAFRFIPSGLTGELDALSPADVISHLRNYLGNYLLDSAVALGYLNHLVQIAKPEHPQVQGWLHYLLRKAVDLQPFSEQARQIQAQLTGRPDLHIQVLGECRLPRAIQESLFSLSARQDIQTSRQLASGFLRSYSYAPVLIEEMLRLDLAQNASPGKGWIEQCQVPPLLQPLLEQQIMKYCLLQGDIERARKHLDRCPGDTNNEIWLNDAAEVYARTGEVEKAINCYRASLKRDPLQIPVHYRLAELEHPFIPDPSVLSSKIAVFLYSCNKSQLLQRTLRSLASTKTGNAQIVVLLNNCTDDSEAAVRAINEHLFSGKIEIISLPVNIGAPAARNWLLATEKGRTAEYVAFLDDDVEIPSDWLIKLLTVLRNNPGSGVAGSKTLAPGKPKQLQYLYRNVSVVSDGLIRLSLDAPVFNHDGGTYDFIRPTANVMGCCHVFTRAALDAAPQFDIRFSPTQMDDIAHDLDLCLKGFKVMYCGLVECVHHQMSGVGRNSWADILKIGNVMGNDVKFYYRFMKDMQGLRELNNLASVPEMPYLQ